MHAAGEQPALEVARAAEAPPRAGGIAVLIVAAIALVYFNSLRTPPVLDDHLAIALNPSIKDPGDLGAVLWPPAKVPTAGRPLLNLSFALNHALGGEAIVGYHVFNVLVHAAAALALWGLVRRTLAFAASAALRANAAWVAATAALAWALHPLTTAAVTYVSQRAESLMGLFYFLTLYAFVRAVQSGRAGWLQASVAACAAGMLVKEVMVTAPVIVLLFDRAFVSGSFGAAWRARRGYYLALAATWLLLAALMIGSRLGERSVGFDQGVTPVAYALGETRVVANYLTLAAWPVPLVFDYGFDVLAARELGGAFATVIALAALAVALWLAVRRPRVGLPLAAVFIVLAPTSSIVPVAMQPMAESRMYVPLAGLVTLCVCGACLLGGRRATIALLALAAAGGALTVRRNRDYASELGLWRDSVAKFPHTARGHNTLGFLLGEIYGESAEAIAQYEQALRINARYDEAHYNLAAELAKNPARLDDAIAHYETALRLNPNYAKAHHGLGNVLVRVPGRLEEGVRHFEAALRLRPNFPEALYNLATVLAGLPGGAPLAIERYEAALALKPGYAEAHNNLANELAKLPARDGEAQAHYVEALRLRPDFAEAHNNFATWLAAHGRVPEAQEHYERALELRPAAVEAHYNLARLLERVPGRLPDAIARYEAALRLQPDHAETHNSLAGALYQAGRLDDAIRHLERALEIRPDFADARENLKQLRALRK